MREDQILIKILYKEETILKEQDKKLLRLVIGGSLICVIVLFVQIVVAVLICGNDAQTFKYVVTIMCLATLGLYMLIGGIGIIKYVLNIEKYRKQQLEKTIKELTTEYTDIHLRYSNPIPKEYFECRAKIDNDGQIVCNIYLDYEVKFKDAKDFLNLFDFLEE